MHPRPVTPHAQSMMEVIFDNKMSRTGAVILKRRKSLTIAVYLTAYLAIIFFENLLLRCVIYFYSPLSSEMNLTLF